MLHSPAVCTSEVGGHGYGSSRYGYRDGYGQPALDIAMMMMIPGRYGYSYGRSSTNTALQPGLNKELFRCIRYRLLCCAVLCCNADALHHALGDRLQPQPICSLTSDKQLIAYDDQRCDGFMANKHVSVQRVQQAVSAFPFPVSRSNPAMTRMKQSELGHLGVAVICTACDIDDIDNYQ